MSDEHAPRVIAIGDIHGCVHALLTLLDAIQPTADDLIISLGDFIDHGRDTCDVIDTLIDLQQRCHLVALLGNHEEVLLEATENEKIKSTWMNMGGFATLNSYIYGADIGVLPADHLEFIRGCRDFYETNTHIFVHANYEPDLPMDEQPDHAMRWTLLDDPQPRPHQSGKKVIVGHTEQRRGDILDLGCVTCIDTYCRGEGWLTALDVTTGEVWQASRFGVLRAPR